jgi:DNA/RNA-binding protein KIN17
MSTVKQVAKAIKARGLQRLRWYCQQCEKQCRDENGFRNHCTTEGHQRAMLLFAEDARRITRDNTAAFERTFLGILGRRYASKRVLANTVYQEHIADRTHVHMNATEFKSFSEFIRHLGERGLALVEETEQGIYITHVSRDPDSAARREAAARSERLERSQGEREAAQLASQMRRAAGGAAGAAGVIAAAEAARAERQAQLAAAAATADTFADVARAAAPVLAQPLRLGGIGLKPLAARKPNVLKAASSVSAAARPSLAAAGQAGSGGGSSGGPGAGGLGKRPSVLEQLRLEEEARKRRRAL